MACNGEIIQTMNLKHINTIGFLLLNLCVYAQKDTVIYENNKIIGKGPYKDKLEFGHWKWYNQKDRIVRNAYYIHGGSIIAIDKDSVTNEIKQIEFLQRQEDYNKDKGFDIKSYLSMYFNDDTLKSVQINNSDWLKKPPEYIYSYQYYPNGLKKAETVFLKSTRSPISSKHFRLNGGTDYESIETDSTLTEKEYYENGSPKFIHNYMLKKPLLQMLRSKIDNPKPSMIELNLDKNGEWLYYNKFGKIIKKEIYKEDKLLKTINY